jgi:hypothetical protein
VEGILAFAERVLPRAAVTAPAFSYLRPIKRGDEGLVDLTGIEPVTS